jgi:hypothetical protein
MSRSDALGYSGVDRYRLVGMDVGDDRGAATSGRGLFVGLVFGREGGVRDVARDRVA